MLPSSSWFHKLPNDSHCDLVVRIPEVGTTSEFRDMQGQHMQIVQLNEILDNKGFCYSIIWKLVTLCSKGSCGELLTKPAMQVLF